MRKLLLLLVLQLLTLQGILLGQIELTVQLQPDSTTYVVKLRPTVSYMAPMNTTNTGQVSFVVPTGGFDPSSVTNIHGLWSNAVVINTPAESPNKDYLVFTLQSGTTDINYVVNEEVELFSFQNTGACTGALEFVANDDPFFPPNSENINLGNQIAVLGAGLGNAFSGTYGSTADCRNIGITPPDNDTITTITIPPTLAIDSVRLNSPSDCDNTDGSIVVFATHQDGNTLQYSVDGGITWSDENTVGNLQSGITYDIRVRDNIGLNFAEYGVKLLPHPEVATITDIIATSPTCNDSTGQIVITATNVLNSAPLRFSLDNGVTWMDSIGDFKNLAAGTYQPAIGIAGVTCVDELDEFLLLAEQCPEEEGEGEGGDSNASNGNNGEEEEEGGEGTGEFIDSLGFAFTDNVTCPFAYILDAQDSVFTISILSDTTLAFPKNITSSAQIVIKVPTGGFMVNDLTNLIDGVIFSNNSRTDAPEEAPGFDYISFGLDTRATQGITYEKGLKVPLFSFTNGGACSENKVELMNNLTDPFINNPATNANQQITVSGTGSDTETCVSTINITDCGLREMLSDTTVQMPIDTTNTGGEMEEEGPDGEGVFRDTSFYNIPLNGLTTICLDSLITIDSIARAFVCEEGNVTITTTDGSACIEIQAKDTFNDSEFVCVVHCDTANVCDTTILSICPSINLGEDLSICSGESVQLNTGGISGTFEWTTTGDISCTDCGNPTIKPTSNQSYIVENKTPKGCGSFDTLMVNVTAAVSIDSVLSQQPTDCKTNGSITIQLTGANAAIQYSIDKGLTYQSSSQFANLGQGNYQVQVRDSSSNCITTWPDTIALAGDAPISIQGVTITDPNSCKNTLGRLMVMIMADSSVIPEYSLDSGATWSSREQGVFDSLAVGTYNLFVRAQNDSCIIAYQNNPIDLAEPAAARIIEGLEDRSFCESDTKVIRLSLNEPISDFMITGGNFEDAVTEDSIFTFKAITTSDTTALSVTLTGESGCSATGEIKLSIKTCEALKSCGFFGGLDTLRTMIVDSAAVACLPISNVDLAEFQFLKDNENFDVRIGECANSSIYYGFNTAVLGTPPYLLQEWIVNNDTLKNFEFSTAEELVNKMNEFDPLGSWVMQEDIGFTGLSGTNTYGPLKLLHINSNASFENPLNNTNEIFQSIILTEAGILNLLIRDSLKNCEDPITIKVEGMVDTTTTEMPMDSMNMDSTAMDTMINILPPLDTLNLITSVNTPLLNQCMTNSSTIIDSISIDECGNPRNGFLLLQDNYCFTYTPNPDFIGKDSFCIVVCSPSMCDTTYVQVQVEGNNLEVFTGFSPNNDKKNDFFTIKNIENFPNNTVQVFNRWGNRVYRKEGYKNDWNGSFDNVLLPDGIYFYVLQVMINNKQEVRSGYVEIIR